MYHCLKILFLCLFIAPQLFAAKVLDEANSYWLCAVYDRTEKNWSARSNYRLTAINKAYEACKKESEQPASCKAAKEHCEAYVGGLPTSPLWQCTALDFYANPYVSIVYKKKYDAALASRAFCEDNSDYPESCYINLIACENLNERML